MEAAEPTTRELLERGNEALLEAAFRTGDFAQARALLEAAFERAEPEGDDAAKFAAADRLGLVCHYENITRLMSGLDVSAKHVDAEEALFRQALEFREDAGDMAGIAQSSFGLGLVAQVLRGDWSAAMQRFGRALEVCEAFGDAVDLFTRSEVHRHVGFYFLVEKVRHEEAIRHLQKSLEVRQELGDARLIPSALEALGEAEFAAGHHGRAAELLEAAVSEGRRVGLLDARIQDAERVLEEVRAHGSHAADGGGP